MIDRHNQRYRMITQGGLASWPWRLIERNAGPAGIWETWIQARQARTGQSQCYLPTESQQNALFLVAFYQMDCQAVGTVRRSN
jgi:hypothetical protein